MSDKQERSTNPSQTPPANPQQNGVKPSSTPPSPAPTKEGGSK